MSIFTVIVECEKQTWHEKDEHVSVSCNIDYSQVKNMCGFMDCIITINNAEDSVECYDIRNENQSATLIMEIPSEIVEKNLGKEDYTFVVKSNCSGFIKSSFNIEITGTTLFLTFKWLNG